MTIDKIMNMNSPSIIFDPYCIFNKYLLDSLIIKCDCHYHDLILVEHVAMTMYELQGREVSTFWLQHSPMVPSVMSFIK